MTKVFFISLLFLTTLTLTALIGSGTENDPYQISTLSDLRYLSETPSLWDNNAYFIQTADIDASDTFNWNDGAGFSPIGDNLNEDGTRKFYGNYDGLHNTISSLYIDRPEQDYVGLFGYFVGDILNIRIIEFNIKGYDYVGGIVGSLLGGGYQCLLMGNISGNDRVGGIVGYYRNSDIKQCFAQCNIQSTGVNCGGLIGYTGFYTSTSNCYSKSIINGNSLVGGIVGRCHRAYLSFCFSSSYVKGESTGGLVGTTIFSPRHSFFDIDLFNDSYTLKDYGEPTQDMKDINTYLNAGWDFIGEEENGTEDIWDIDSNINDGYPYLVWAEDFLIYDDETLPVELSSFTAIPTPENYAQVNWSTASESNLIGFNIFRSDNSDFNIANKVNGTIINAHNSTNYSRYSFIDNELVENLTYYYWLESCELNNENVIHGPISVIIKDNEDGFEIDTPQVATSFSVYPNPFNPSTSVKFYIKKKDKVLVDVYNIRGQFVSNLTNKTHEEGYHNVVWSGKDHYGVECVSGIYFFKIKTSATEGVIKAILLK